MIFILGFKKEPLQAVIWVTNAFCILNTPYYERSEPVAPFIRAIFDRNFDLSILTKFGKIAALTRP